MAIAQANVIAATGDTTNATSYTTPSAAPTALRLLIFVVIITYTSTDQDFTISGGPSVTWEEFINYTTLGSGRRIKVWAALSGSSPGSGAITINALASATGCVYYMTEFNGAYISGNALSALYGLAISSIASTSNIQTPPTGPYNLTNDATLSILSKNSSSVSTAERTLIAEAGYSTPVQRLGMQWFLGNDSDGPLFSWAAAGVADAWSFYLRDTANPPPVPAFSPSIVTVSV